MLLPTIIFLSLGKNIFEFLLITWTWWILPSIIFLLNRNIFIWSNWDINSAPIFCGWFYGWGYIVISLSWMCFYMTRLLWSNIIEQKLMFFLFEQMNKTLWKYPLAPLHCCRDPLQYKYHQFNQKLFRGAQLRVYSTDFLL